ncbi:MAG: OmpA family protein, partial [Bacteroidota bacterium]
VQPIYFVKEKLLVFSSDKKGGEGGFDLYGTFNQDSCWSPVFSLGREVNTAGDEIFPSELNGELSFTRLVSDQKRNYSVPLNSQFFGVKDQQSLPTCIRMIEIAPNVVYLERENKFYFYKKDVTSEYYTLRLTNELGEPLLCELRMERNEGFSSINLLSNIQGETEKFSFSKNEKVKFILGDKCREISGFIYATLYTSDGNAIRKYKFNRKGELILELLDFVFSGLSYKENKDFSVLCCEYDKSVFKQTTLYFDNNSFEIDAANIEIFNKWFSENVSLVTGGKFILTSYTSGDGLKERNLKLAEDRIKSGVKILLERGVELRQIDTKIGGLNEQVLDGRRIEIQFIPL